MRWRLRLAEFDIEMKYKKGKMNTQKDARSHLKTLGRTSKHNESKIIGVFEQELVDGEL